MENNDNDDNRASQVDVEPIEELIAASGLSSRKRPQPNRYVQPDALHQIRNKHLIQFLEVHGRRLAGSLKILKKLH